MDGLFSGFASVLIASTLGVALAAGAVGLTLEKLWPASRISPRSRWLSVWFAFADSIVQDALGPLTFAWAMLFLGHLGAGLIPLSNEGFGLVVSAAAYLLVLDFVGYWLHRCEHSVPALWAMHSFHHSETEINTFTTHRVYWLSRLYHGAFYTPIMGLLFVATPNVLLIALIVQVLVTATNHVNVRVHLGRFGLLIMGPQYHRIHHSLERKHWDKNFAHRFPVFDLIFGTMWAPTPDEWPETGVEGAPPESVGSVLLWPLDFVRKEDPASAPEA